MRLKNLKIKVHGPKRAVRDTMENNATVRPALVHAPVAVPVADAAVAQEDTRQLEQVMGEPAAPSPRAVADAVYRMFVDDMRRKRLRG